MLAIVITAFAIALISVIPIRIEQMTADPYFVFQVIPISFWISICVIACMLFFMFPHLKKRQFQIIFIFATILLIIGFRIAFPVSFTSVPAYEPDTTRYMTTVSSWTSSGIDFGVEKNYEHDYPLSFLFAFVFVKLGIPVDSFFRIAPFVIYAIDTVLIYLILKEIVPESKRSIPLISIFLFSFSSLGYWVSVHYCPNIVGTLFFFLSLYFVLLFAKSGVWSIKTMLPMFVCIYLLILSHHLSTLYFIITLFGFALSMWFFKPQSFKGGALSFFIMGIFTYTIWFVYGSLVYPSFFNVYVYFTGFESLSQQTAVAGWINNVAFAIYPGVIFALFAIEFLRKENIGNPIAILKHPKIKLKELRVFHTDNLPIVFTAGFILVFGLFAIGFAVPSLFGTRILELVCVGLYPFASQTLVRYTDSDSWKKKALVLFLTIFLVITGIYRYYTQIQRRVMF